MYTYTEQGIQNVKSEFGVYFNAKKTLVSFLGHSFEITRNNWMYKLYHGAVPILGGPLCNILLSFVSARAYGGGYFKNPSH